MLTMAFAYAFWAFVWGAVVLIGTTCLLLGLALLGALLKELQGRE